MKTLVCEQYSNKILNAIRDLIGSQYKARKIGDMDSCFLVLVTSLAAARVLNNLKFLELVAW